MAPVMVALVAFYAPARVTLKGALSNVLLPRDIPSAVLKETLVLPLPAIRDAPLKVNPPIAPDVAVTAPALVTLKGAELKVLFPRWIPSAVLSETLVALAPAINDVDPRVKPPTAPEVDVKAPAGVTLKGADPNVAFPKYMPFESALNILLLDPIDIVPPDSAPVNVPLAEDKAPLNVPDVAVRTPASVTLNGAFALLAKVAPA